MAEIEIRFRMNMRTGKKDILIDYESDEDAMRHEHEKDHKDVVQRLIGAGVLTEDEVGEIVVERAQPGQVAKQTEPPPQQPETQTNEQGQ